MGLLNKAMNKIGGGGGNNNQQNNNNTYGSYGRLEKSVTLASGELTI